MRIHGAAALVLILALVGCQSGASGSAESAAPTVGFSMLPTSVPSAPSGQAESDESDAEDDDTLAAACDVETIGGVQEVVRQQLAAFKARDFAAAFNLASSQFTSISTVESLRALIMDGRHAEVADSASHEFTECRQPEPGLVYAAVSVTGQNGRTVSLVYQFVKEDGAWRILQSAPMGGHGGSTEAPESLEQAV